MTEFVIATRNAGKIAEIVAAFGGLDIKLLSLNDFDRAAEPDENGETFFANALLKARYYMQLTGKTCLADDSGLEVDALNGAPGVYSARYAGPDATTEQRNAKLLAELANVPDDKRSARFRCTMVLLKTDGSYITADGTCEGKILREQTGAGGFGYDPLFFATSAGKAMAELTMKEKNAISHRGRAIRQLVNKIKEKMT